MKTLFTKILKLIISFIFFICGHHGCRLDDKENKDNDEKITGGK